MTIKNASLIVFKAIREAIKEQEEQGVYPISPPTQRDLVAATGIASTNTINYHIKKLTGRGLLVRGHYGTAHLSKEGAKMDVVDEDGELVLVPSTLAERVNGDDLWRLRFEVARRECEQVFRVRPKHNPHDSVSGADVTLSDEVGWVFRDVEVFSEEACRNYLNEHQ